MICFLIIGSSSHSALFTSTVRNDRILKYSDDSLNGYNINTSMTRVETAYMVMQKYFKNGLAKLMLQRFRLILQPSLCFSPSFDGGETHFISQTEPELL